MLNELESQNDEQVAGILGKVKVLKDVSQAMGTILTLAYLEERKGEREGQIRHPKKRYKGAMANTMFAFAQNIDDRRNW